jgi:hypothetical protein
MGTTSSRTRNRRVDFGAGDEGLFLGGFMRALIVLAVFAVLACKPEEAPHPQSPPSGLNLGDLPPPASGHLRGRIELAPDLQGKVAAGDTVYIIARNAATGGVIAVARLSAPATFPMPFELTGAHVMMPGGSLSGQVRLAARVDKDGNATSKTPGDLVAELPQLVAVPNDSVVLVLNQVL